MAKNLVSGIKAVYKVTLRVPIKFLRYVFQTLRSLERYITRTLIIGGDEGAGIHHNPDSDPFDRKASAEPLHRQRPTRIRFGMASLPTHRNDLRDVATLRSVAAGSHLRREGVCYSNRNSRRRRTTQRYIECPGAEDLVPHE